MNVAICIADLASILIDSFIRPKFESQHTRNSARPPTRSLACAKTAKVERTRGTEHSAAQNAYTMMTKEYVAWIKICIKMCISFGHFNLSLRVCISACTSIFGAIKWWTKSADERASDKRMKINREKAIEREWERNSNPFVSLSVYWNSGKAKTEKRISINKRGIIE